MLPPLEADERGEASGDCVTGAELPAGGEVQSSRLQWRSREIALQRMIGATSTARVGRALRARAAECWEGRFRGRP
eukprot:5959863-Pyramimonas_sp.AAC.1